jgi:hypothetical protein
MTNIPLYKCQNGRNVRAVARVGAPIIFSNLNLSKITYIFAKSRKSDFALVLISIYLNI